MIPLIIPLLGRLGGAVVAGVRAVPAVVWLVLAAGIAAYCYGEARADARESEVRAEYDLRAMKEAEQAQQLFAELEADHRKKEASLAYEILQGEATHAQALRDAEARALATVDGLKRGNVKLRDHWQACLGKLPGPGQAAGPAGEPIPSADLRTEAIGRIRRTGAECDAEITQWQTDWQKAVKAINGVRDVR